jgi:hypothetical protein
LQLTLTVQHAPPFRHSIVYLGSTIQGQHDAMRRFEERRAAAAERPQDATSRQTGGPMPGEGTSGARPKVQ